MSRRDEVVELDVLIKQETDKAYLIDHGGENAVWMPKSQVRGLVKGDRSVKLTVTEWIANEKGLI